MKRIVTSNITASVGLPIKSGTLDHLQSSYKEAIASSIIRHIPDYQNNLVYRLYGVFGEQTGTLPPFNVIFSITGGALFYNGEVYIVDPIIVNLNLSTSQRAVLQIQTTYFTAPEADPVTFTDFSQHNIHENKKLTFVAGATGTGISNIEDIVDYRRDPKLDTGAIPTTLNFSESKIFIDDFQTPPVSLSFDVDPSNAIVGNKIIMFIGTDQVPGTTFNFVSSFGDWLFFLPNSFTSHSFNSSSIVDPLPVCLEFEYMGKDNYNNSLVRVNITKTR